MQPPAPEPTAEPAPSPSPVAEATEPPPTAAPSVTPVPSVTFTLTVAPSATATLSPTPEPERVRVFGNDNEAVNLRREPGTNAPVIKTVREGTELIIVGLDRDVGGRIWRNVRDGDVVGWIVGGALRALPTPTVTPSVTPTPVATATPSPTQPATGTPTPGGTPPAGTPEPERVEITGTGGQGANLRAEPSTSARVLQTVPDGTQLTIAGPDREADGYTWRNVRGESGTVGWVISEAVRPLGTPTPAPTDTPAATETPAPTSTQAATDTPEPTSEPTAQPAPTASATPAPPAPGEGEGDSDGEDSEGEDGDGEGEDAAGESPPPEQVEVYDTGATGANLRARPGLGGSVLQSVPDGTILSIIGEDQVADGIIWRNVQMEDGTTGWLAVEVIRPWVAPTPTPRPGAPGIGAPIVNEALPEDELTEAQRIATPCRPGQLKGDADTGVYYPPDHPEYAGLRLRVRCFDDANRAEASGYRPPEPPEATPSPAPEP